MAKKRGPDGVPTEVPSILHGNETKGNSRKSLLDFGGDAGELGGEEPTAPRGDAPGGRRATGAGLFPDDPPTAPPKRSGGASGGRSKVPEEPPTIIGRSKKGAATTEQAPKHAEDNAAKEAVMNDPVAGWLVVIDGPGQGAFHKIGYGQNTIGRGTGQRISLDYGDGEISRDNHATLTYDPRGNKFYIQQGAGKNLAYLNESPVLAPIELMPLSHINLGATTLRFVPLCAEDFTWDSYTSNDREC